MTGVQTCALPISTSAAHWLTPDPTGHRHGSGLDGAVTVAGRLTVHSLVRGAWEVRLARVESLEPGITAETLRLRVGGWPISAAAPVTSATVDSARVAAGTLSSGIRAVVGAGESDTHTRPHSTPLNAVTAVPTIEYPVLVGEWTATIVELTGLTAGYLDCTVDLVARGDDWAADITWPDGAQTSSALTDHRTAHAER